MLLHLLRNIGLSEKETTIYLALLKSGSASAIQLSKQTGIKAATAYVQLEDLVKKGLISKLHRNEKAVYIPNDPSSIKHYLEQKEKELQDLESQLKDNLSELSSVFLSSQSKSTVRTYEGKEGLEALENDADKFNLDVVKQVFSFTPLDIVDDFKSDQEVSSRRVSRGTSINMIYTHKSGVQNLTNPQLLREARFLPREGFPFNASVVIAPNHSIRIASYKKGFFAIWIENTEIANTMKTIFDICWSQAQIEKSGTNKGHP